jgi:hypothetical protein
MSAFQKAIRRNEVHDAMWWAPQPRAREAFRPRAALLRCIEKEGARESVPLSPSLRQNLKFTGLTQNSGQL